MSIKMCRNAIKTLITYEVSHIQRFDYKETYLKYSNFKSLKTKVLSKQAIACQLILEKEKFTDMLH